MSGKLCLSRANLAKCVFTGRKSRGGGETREGSGTAPHSRTVGEDPLPGSVRHNLITISVKSLEAKRLSEILGNL